jgi:hypothetical protein
MKNFFLLLTIAALPSLSSCSKEPVETKFSNPDQVFEIKEILNNAAIELRAPELDLSTYEITLALKGQHPLEGTLRNDCTDWCFKREKLGSSPSVEYRVDVFTIVTQLLPYYGQTVSSTNPRDTNGDNFIGGADLLTMLTFFGNDFETVPLDQVNAIGGEVSGSGELANYNGDLVFDGDTLDLISLFKGSNCFVQDYQSGNFDPLGCYEQTMLSFTTNTGVVKFFHIN